MPILVTCECGKQFQARDENVGRRFQCPDCGREVTVSKPDTGPYPDPMFDGPSSPRTSGKAIAGVVLGVLSLVCSLFTGIPAVIFGSLGLSDIGSSRGRLRGKGLAITAIVLGSLGSLLSIVAVLGGLMIPAMSSAREAARRAQCINNLKQIGLAFHNYHDLYDRFPAAAIAGADGKPLLSWRVAILPMLDQKALYDRFKLDEPWDGPNNIKLLDQMPMVFRCPTDPPLGLTRTAYQAVVGPGTIFDGPEGTTIGQVTDGASNTILVVESGTPVDWTRPDDVDLAMASGAIGGLHPGGSNALFADGSVKFLKKTVPPNAIRALITRQGGEVVSPDAY